MTSTTEGRFQAGEKEANGVAATGDTPHYPSTPPQPRDARIAALAGELARVESLPNRSQHVENVDEKGQPIESGSSAGDAEQVGEDDLEDEYPDGGLAAWKSVVGAWMTMFCAFGFMNSMGVFQAYYIEGPLKQYSPSTVAWIAAMQLFFIFAGGIFIGPIFDAYGPRLILLGCTIGFPFGIFMTSLSTQYYQFFLSQAAVVGLSSAGAFVGGANAVCTWFFKRRGMAMGIVASGSSVGGVLFPIIVSQALPRVGFGWTMRIIGFIILTLLVTANFLITSRLQHPMSFKERKFVLFDFHAFEDQRFLWFALGCLLQILGLFAPVNYLSSFAIARGLSPGMAFYLIAVLNAASTFGRIIPGFIGDKIGRFTVFAAMSFFSGLLSLVMWPFIHTQGELIAYSAIYGFMSGAFISMYMPCLAQISDIRYLGRRVGTLNLVTALLALSSLPIDGALIRGEKHDNYLGLQMFAGFVMIGGALLLVVARWHAAGKKWMTIT